MSVNNPEWYELPAIYWQELNSNGQRFWQDSRKERIYSAETDFNYYMWPEFNTRPFFDSLEDIQKYVDKILSSAWVRRRWGEQDSVKVENHSKTCDANKSQRRIRLAHWGWNKVVVLHEISHILHRCGYGTAHGRYFARTFLELITHEFGIDARKILKQAYKRRGVLYYPIPQYSKETKERMSRRGKQLAEKYFQKVEV